MQDRSKIQARLLTAEKQTFSRIYRHCWLWKLQLLTLKLEWPQFHRVIQRKLNKYEKKQKKREWHEPYRKVETWNSISDTWLLIGSRFQECDSWIIWRNPQGFNYPASLSVFNKQPANPADGCHAGVLFGERVSPAFVYWKFLRIRVQEECNQESFLPAPGINPAVSQLWNSIDLCRRNTVLLSHVPLLCGSAMWKLTALSPLPVPEALVWSEKCPVKSL